MKKTLLVLAASLVVPIAIVSIRTVRFTPPARSSMSTLVVPVRTGAAERLAGSLRLRTISHADPSAFDTNAFANLHAYLAQSFPSVHARLDREVVGSHSLLYTWRGSDPFLKPLLLMGHMDVVPVEAGTETQWREEPFAGTIADGFVWGRGAIDNKSAVVGTLEAIESLLTEGFRPKRTVLLGYGHDEEVGGTHGARAIAALLKQRGVQLEMVVDEGGVIGEGIIAGVSMPTALVGIAEKGFVTVELTARSSGGHSSLPPRQSAIGILGEAVARLERNQLRARFTEPSLQLFDRVAREFPLGQRLVFANLWLTKPLVLGKLQEAPATNAMVRTTTAVTIIEGGTKDNVLPSSARAIVNFRILQGESVDGVLNHVRRTIDDPRIQIRRAGAFFAEPSSVSSATSNTFKNIERSINAIAPDAIVAPFLVVVVSDARHFSGLSENIFRFLPLRLTPTDLARMHGTDERISVRDYENAVRIYRQLIINATGGPTTAATVSDRPYRTRDAAPPALRESRRR